MPSLTIYPVVTIADFGPEMADTESESVAERVFKKLGYEEIGKVPNYSLNASSELKDGVFLYKTLNT